MNNPHPKTDPFSEIPGLSNKVLSLSFDGDDESEAAKKGLAYMLDLDDRAAQEYWNIFAEFETVKRSLRADFVSLFSENATYKTLISEIRRKIGQYHERFSQAKENKITDILTEWEFDDRSILGAVRAVGYVDDATYCYQSPHASQLYDLVVVFIDELRSLPARPLSSLQLFLDNVSRFAKKDAMLARYFLEDFAYLLQQESETRAPILTGNNKFEFVARLPVEVPQSSFDTLNTMIEFADNYGRIGQNGLTALIGEEQPGRRHELVRRIIRDVDLLAEQGIKTIELSYLLRAGQGQGNALLGAIVENPNIAFLWQKIRKTQLSADKYVFFLLEYAYAPIEGTEQTAFDFIYSLASCTSQANNVRQLIETDALWILDDQIVSFFEKIKYRTETEAIVSSYLQYLSEGLVNKLDFIRAISTLPFSDEIKQARRQLEALNDEEVGRLMNISDPLRLIKAINDRPQPQGMQKSAERRNWENLLYDSYPDQPVLKAAYSILQTHRLEDRLRNMWMTQPQSLIGFAGEVVKYRDDKLVFEGIASPGIYRLMKEHLLRDGSFRDALTASVSQAKPAQNYEFSQEIENSIQKIPLSKIVICGDRFSSEAQRVISQELFPIIPVFYNSMKRERNLQFETDAVFCVASKIDHNSYYLMRRICRSHEIPFYHLNKKGIDSVVSFVRQVAE